MKLVWAYFNWITSYSTDLLHRCGPNNRTFVNFNCNSPIPILKQARGILSEMKRTKATNMTPLSFYVNFIHIMQTAHNNWKQGEIKSVSGIPLERCNLCRPCLASDTHQAVLHSFFCCRCFGASCSNQATASSRQRWRSRIMVSESCLG